VTGSHARAQEAGRDKCFPKIVMPDPAVGAGGVNGPCELCRTLHAVHAKRRMMAIRGATDLQRSVAMRPDPVFDAAPGSGRSLPQRQSPPHVTIART